MAPLKPVLDSDGQLASELSPSTKVDGPIEAVYVRKAVDGIRIPQHSDG